MKRIILSLTIVAASLFSSVQVEAAKAPFPGVVTETVDILPDVPFIADPHYYFSDFLIYVAVIIMITFFLKKVLKWEDKKALILSLVVGAVITGIGWFFKLGLLAVYDWWGAIAWYVGFIVGSWLGYDKIKLVLQHLGFSKK